MALKETPADVARASAALSGSEQENAISVIAADLKRRYPRADNTEIVNHLLTAYCPLVKKQNMLSDREKREKINRFFTPSAPQALFASAYSNGPAELKSVLGYQRHQPPPFHRQFPHSHEPTFPRFAPNQRAVLDIQLPQLRAERDFAKAHLCAFFTPMIASTSRPSRRVWTRLHARDHSCLVI